MLVIQPTKTVTHPGATRLQSNPQPPDRKFDILPLRYQAVLHNTISRITSLACLSVRLSCIGYYPENTYV